MFGVINRNADYLLTIDSPCGSACQVPSEVSENIELFSLPPTLQSF
jgi:hypothetical protein